MWDTASEARQGRIASGRRLPACPAACEDRTDPQGNLGELARLTAETEQFCEQHSLAANVEFDLNLVLEELFVNSIRHGGCESLEGTAEFRLTLLPDGVSLEYADRGAPFDPTQARAPDLTAPLEQRPDGGLGIHLMRQVMRDIEYHRVGGWNRIRMRRPIPSERT
jgi:serine/threonine-protein kinase RsbW